MNDANDIHMQPIGVVRTDVPDAAVAARRREMISRIVMAHAFSDGLLGIEAYSHLFVLFWLHRQARAAPLAGHPRGDPTLPITEVFAARGRNHPNAIGLAVVELLARRENVLEVRRLDAWDGTPVLDVKPYDLYDVVEHPRVPEWFHRRAMTRPE